MKLQHQDYTFELLTPAMIGGAEGKTGNAEMRIASIRGQVRWWHRKAALQPSCTTLWGQTEPSVIGSKVSLALLPAIPARYLKATILPHKGGAQRDALPNCQHFQVRLTRLVGCSPDDWGAAQKAVKLWLLLGSLGLRANRAAGSVWPVGAWVPTDEASLTNVLIQLGYRHPVSLTDASILRHNNLTREPTDALKLRHAASDTVSVPKYFGSIKPRTPSPLKMKVIRLGTDYRLLLTGLPAADLAGARNALGTHKPLGSVVWHSL